MVKYWIAAITKCVMANTNPFIAWPRSDNLIKKYVANQVCTTRKTQPVTKQQKNPSRTHKFAPGPRGPRHPVVDQDTGPSNPLTALILILFHPFSQDRDGRREAPALINKTAGRDACRIAARPAARVRAADKKKTGGPAPSSPARFERGGRGSPFRRSRTSSTWLVATPPLAGSPSRRGRDGRGAETFPAMNDPGRKPPWRGMQGSPSPRCGPAPRGGRPPPAERVILRRAELATAGPCAVLSAPVRAPSSCRRHGWPWQSSLASSRSSLCIASAANFDFAAYVLRPVRLQQTPRPPREVSSRELTVPFLPFPYDTASLHPVHRPFPRATTSSAGPARAANPATSPHADADLVKCRPRVLQ